MNELTHERWNALYHSLNRMLVAVGMDGEINARSNEVLEVMADLAEIDDGRYSEDLPAPPLQDRQDAIKWRALRDVTDEELGAAGIPCVALPSGPYRGSYMNAETAEAAIAARLLKLSQKGIES